MRFSLRSARRSSLAGLGAAQFRATGSWACLFEKDLPEDAVKALPPKGLGAAGKGREDYAKSGRPHQKLYFLNSTFPLWPAKQAGPLQVNHRVRFIPSRLLLLRSNQNHWCWHFLARAAKSSVELRSSTKPDYQAEENQARNRMERSG